MFKIKEFYVSYKSLKKYIPYTSRILESIFSEVYSKPQHTFYSYKLKKRISWSSLWSIEENNRVYLKIVNLNIGDEAFRIELFSQSLLLIDSPFGLIKFNGDHYSIDWTKICSIEGNYSTEEGINIIDNIMKNLEIIFNERRGKG